jgi:hypothetical protein
MKPVEISLYCTFQLFVVRNEDDDRSNGARKTLVDKLVLAFVGTSNWRLQLLLRVTHGTNLGGGEGVQKYSDDFTDTTSSTSTFARLSPQY